MGSNAGCLYPKNLLCQLGCGEHCTCTAVNRRYYTYLLYLNNNNNVKGKAVPLQAWSGPEGSRKLWFPDFLTTTHYGGKVVSLTHRPHLPPGNTPGTHIC
jgi:hypothetical protein